MIKLEISGSTAEELRQMLLSLSESLSAPAPVAEAPAPAPVAEAPARKPRKPAPVQLIEPEAEAPAPAQEAEASAPEAEAPAPVAQLSYDKDVRPSLLKLSNLSREAAIGVLKKYGTDSGKNLKPETFLGVIQDAKAAIAKIESEAF